MEDNTSVVKAGLWYTISNILLRGIAFLTAPIFNRLLSQEEIGAFSNIQSWTSIFLVIFTFELFSSVNIARFDYKKDKYDGYILSITVLGSLITLFFFLLFLIFSDLWVNFFNIKYEYFVIIFVYLLLCPAINIYIEKYKSLLQYKNTILITMLNSILTVALSLVLVFIMEDKLFGRIIGVYIPSSFIGLCIFLLIIYKGKKVNVKDWRYALKISVPLAVHLLSGTILSSSDRIMITNICGNSDTALYSVAYLVASIILLVWTSISSAWAPWCFIQLANKKNDAIRIYSRYLLIIVGMAFLLVSMIAPECMLILGGEKYAKAAYTIPPIISGCLAVVAYTFYVNIEQFMKQQKFIAIGTFIAAASNIALNYIFIPIYGYEAAAYTTLAGYLLLFLFHYFITNHKLHIKVYDNVFFFCFLFGGITLILITSLLYPFRAMRLAIVAITIIIVCSIFLIKRKLIFKLLQEKL